MFTSVYHLGNFNLHKRKRKTKKKQCYQTLNQIYALNESNNSFFYLGEKLFIEQKVFLLKHIPVKPEKQIILIWNHLEIKRPLQTEHSAKQATHSLESGVYRFKNNIYHLIAFSSLAKTT